MATSETYSKLFDNIIESINTSGVENADALCRLVQSSRASILNVYIKLNRLSKRLYMVDPNGLLDRHKCSACFIIAFVHGLLIESSSFDIKVYENYREKLALLAGLSVLKTFIVGNSKDPKNAELANFLKNRDFSYPGLLCDTPPPSYEEIWLFEIHNSYKRGRLSVLQLAHELFLIECHNRFLAKNGNAFNSV